MCSFAGILLDLTKLLNVNGWRITVQRFWRNLTTMILSVILTIYFANGLLSIVQTLTDTTVTDHG